MIKIALYTGYLLVLLNTILFLKGFSSKGKPFRILTLYSVCMTLIQLSSWIYGKIYRNNIFFNHIYLPIQFIVLSWFFYELTDSKKQKKLILLMVPTVLTIVFINFCIHPEQLTIFSELEIFITSLPIISYAVMHLYAMLSQPKQFYFFTTGIVIYLFGSTVFFLTGNFQLSIGNSDVARFLFGFNIYLYIVYQLFILYDFKYHYLKESDEQR